MNSLPALIGGLVTVLTILAAIVQIADYLEKKRRKKPEAVLPAAEPAPAAAASPPQTEVPPQVKNGSTAVNEVPSAPYLQTFAGDNITEIPAKGMMEN